MQNRKRMFWDSEKNANYVLKYHFDIVFFVNICTFAVILMNFAVYGKR